MRPNSAFPFPWETKFSSQMILFLLSDDSKWLICCRESNLASCGWKQHFFYWLLFRQYQAFDPMWPASAVKHSSSASLLVLSRITPESTSEILTFIIISNQTIIVKNLSLIIIAVFIKKAFPLRFGVYIPKFLREITQDSSGLERLRLFLNHLCHHPIFRNILSLDPNYFACRHESS